MRLSLSGVDRGLVDRDGYLSKKLEDAISEDTSGDFKKLLFSLVQGARDNYIHTDSLKAHKDAETLAKPLEKKLLGGGGDKFEKYRVLATDSFHQLQRVFDEFQRKTGSTLDKTIEKELSGDLLNAVLSLYKIAAHGHARYFVDLIHEAFKSKKDEDVIRIFVARSEIDLENIKEVYLSVYGKSLVNAVKEEVKGVNQEALLALLRGNKSFSQ